MDPAETGMKYNKIAYWWHQHQQGPAYGMEAFKKAMGFHPGIQSALDIGCGPGGRFIQELDLRGCSVHGIDVSAEMVSTAKKNHPNHTFEIQNICSWEIPFRFDFVYAWDSIFHIPLKEHPSVIRKMCCALKPGGILIYTFGHAIGEHTDTWMDDTFYYSSIGINGNIEILLEKSITLLHLELDQYPENHAVVIGQAP
jgi:trans-aconitate methyltransferase